MKQNNSAKKSSDLCYNATSLHVTSRRANCQEKPYIDIFFLVEEFYSCNDKSPNF